MAIATANLHKMVPPYDPNEQPDENPLHDMHQEMHANVTLAYRHLEDSRMRLGKVIQAAEGGTSIYDSQATMDVPVQPHVEATPFAKRTHGFYEAPMPEAEAPEEEALTFPPGVRQR
jgi:hypothetical protein